MDNVTTAGHAPVGTHAHGHASHAHADHHEQSFVTKWIFSQDHKVIGIQYTMTALLFLLFGFGLMALMRYQLAFPMQPIPVIGSPARRRERARRHHAAGVLQPARRHARHHHGVPRRRAARGRRLRQLRDAADDRRARHGVPQAQHGELLGVLHRRRASCWRASSCPAAPRSRAGRRIRRCRSSPPPNGQTWWLDRHDLPDHLVAARLGELHRHHHPAAREGARLLPAAVLRVGAVRHELPAAARVSAARSGRRAAADGQGGGHELLPAERPRRGQSAARRVGRRQRAALAAPVLVPRASRGVRADSARDGHRQRDHREQHAQAALGLSRAGLRHHLPRASCRSSCGRTTCS